MVAVTNNATTTIKVSHKSGTRHTAENSLMSTICYLMVVASTHFFVGEPNKLYHKKKVSEATKGSIALRQLVSRCNHNAPVYPVLPSLLMSTDDTTVFTFRGTMEKGE